MKKKNVIPYGHQSIDNKDINEVVKVLRSDWLTQGPKIEEFEEALCKYTGAKYAVVVCNATAALHLACLASNIQRGDEVITSPITFVATSNSIIYAGAKPVFADIQDDTINIDPLQIKAKISKKTKGIIPVHFAGHPADLEEIYKIAKKSNLFVIEDASHALGAEYKGTTIGNCKYSDMTVFSFHPVKLITTGEGGAVLTNRKDLYQKILLLRNHGITKKQDNFVNFNDSTDSDWYYEMQELGYNYRLTDFQCALGIMQLKKLDDFIQKRRRIVKTYTRALSLLPQYSLPIERSYVKSSWHIYNIRMKDANNRLKLFNKLRKLRIGCQVIYIPVYYQPYYKRIFGNSLGLCPIAEKYYNETLTIPLFPNITKDEIDYVVKALQ